ncbi:MAG: hypothetical protein LBT11_03485 [Treponema sp.]|nr:hypothetical protein [Treponema sp.]
MKKNKFLFLGMLAKVTAVTLALVFALALTGCGGDPLVGTWLSEAGEGNSPPAGAYKLVVTAPNTWVMSMGSLEVQKGTYSGTTLTLTHAWNGSAWAESAGSIEAVIASDGKTLTMSEMSFKKQ